MNTKIIAERIRELRTENNLSQAKFGEKLGLSQDTISLWETGKSLPSLEDVLKIIETFSKHNDRITADYLLGLDIY